MPKEELKNEEVLTSPSVEVQEPTLTPPAPANEPVAQPKEDAVALLQRQVAELQEMLNTVADKNKVDAFRESKRNRSQKTINVSVYNDKIVTEWSNLTTNKRLKEDGQFVGKHTTNLKYADGSEDADVDYLDFQKDRMLVEAIVEVESKDAAGEITFQAKTEKLGQVTINSRFIN